MQCYTSAMARPTETVSSRPDGPHSPEGPSPEPTMVYCVHGAAPEVQAYGMAKYSRSALSMKESLTELNQQRAEQFLNTFYFQYGHRSIADLAHVTTAIESLSLLAAIAVVDEQRWDGQERSTRYQDFRRSSHYVPEFSPGPAAELYQQAIAFLFSEYQQSSQYMFDYLAGRVPRPRDMKPEIYERTLRARAFDVARYLLPLATNTSLGQIVNARTLETQIARLLAHTHAEVRLLGTKLKEAAQGHAYKVDQESVRALVEAIRAKDEALGQRAEEQLLRETPVCPTLVKYAEPSVYEMETRRELRQAATELMGSDPIDEVPAVTLLQPESLETELATTLLYPYCHFPYEQIRRRVEALSPSQRDEIVALGARHRGQHDELLRAFCAGQSFRFDVLMDIGSYRDLHRHRRCTQFAQEFTTVHGFELPEEITAAELGGRFTQAMEHAESAASTLTTALESQSGNAPQPEPAGTVATEAQYLIPLAFRKRALFKMDFAEVVYIAELRTTPAGHRSYRNIAWQMYEAVAKRHPSLGRYFRVHDVSQPVDLLQR